MTPLKSYVSWSLCLQSQCRDSGLKRRKDWDWDWDNSHVYLRVPASANLNESTALVSGIPPKSPDPPLHMIFPNRQCSSRNLLPVGILCRPISSNRSSSHAWWHSAQTWGYNLFPSTADCSSWTLSMPSASSPEEISPLLIGTGRTELQPSPLSHSNACGTVLQGVGPIVRNQDNLNGRWKWIIEEKMKESTYKFLLLSMLPWGWCRGCCFAKEAQACEMLQVNGVKSVRVALVFTSKIPPTLQFAPPLYQRRYFTFCGSKFCLLPFHILSNSLSFFA